jgi:anaerobic selenocysteine-containing dehydrogenase
MANKPDEKIVRTACMPFDGGSCGLLAHVKDGILVKVEPADFPEPEYRRICARGLVTPKLVYHPDRLKHPLKRVGERGEGKWQRVSWDEALDTIAARFKEIAQKYGSRSVGWICLARTVSHLAYERLAAAYGGSWIISGGPGDAAGPCADIVSYGMPIGFMEGVGYEADFENPELCVIWGNNLVETGVRQYRRIRDAQERGGRVVVIDPRFTPTAAKANEYIPIRPGTDSALALGLINQIIGQGLEDKAFIGSYTVGPFLVRNDNGLFLREKDINSKNQTNDYVIWDINRDDFCSAGEPDAVPALKGSYVINGIDCKPAFQLLAELAELYSLERTSEITEIEKDAIKKLAVDYATRKPVVSFKGWGPQRTFHGDLTHRAIITLAAITGNVSLKGPRQIVLNRDALIKPGGRSAGYLFISDFYEAIISQKPYPLKALWTAGINLINQFPDENKVRNELIPGLEFIVVVDLFMTATAEYADIVLPATTFMECSDLVMGWMHPYLQLQQKAIEPLHEARPDFEIINEMAKRMGAGEYFDKTMDECIEMVLSSDHPSSRGVTLKRLKQGPVRVPAYENPAFLTPSGRIEFYSERLREFGEQLPVYKESLENNRGSLSKKYPLCFLQTHTRSRVHSLYANIDWLREFDPEPKLEMNPADAEKRGIQDGDLVLVFNERGRLKIKVMVHEGIKPGVVNVNQGWWPKDFLAGTHQTLTHDAVNPAQKAVFMENTAFYDVLVQVEKAEED